MYIYIHNNYRHCIWNHQPILHGQKNKNQLGGTVKHRYFTTILESMCWSLGFVSRWWNSSWSIRWIPDETNGVSPMVKSWEFTGPWEMFQENSHAPNGWYPQDVPPGDINHWGIATTWNILGIWTLVFFFQYLQAVPPSPGPQTKYTSKEQSLQTEFEETDPHRSRKIMAVEGGTFYIGLLAQ
jgi:hypothetical protein